VAGTSLAPNPGVRVFKGSCTRCSRRLGAASSALGEAVLSYCRLQQHPWDRRDSWGAEECDARSPRQPRSHGHSEASSAPSGVGTVAGRVALPSSRHRPAAGNLPGAGQPLAGLTWLGVGAHGRTARSFWFPN